VLATVVVPVVVPVVVAVLVGLLGPVPNASAARAIEGYAAYQPQERCADRVKPGTRALSRWVFARGGRPGGFLRACSSGGTSEHKDGRAFDWTLDASRKRHRRLANRMLDTIFAADRHDRRHARARRMGIMYIIWNDTMYAAWDRFAAEPYLSSSCRTRRRCSASLRHRDHMHVSLGRPGARGDTSWYDGRLS
jgi:hypothetical protein